MRAFQLRPLHLVLDYSLDAAYSLPRGRRGRRRAELASLVPRPLPERQVLAARNRDPSPPPRPPHPLAPLPPSGGPKRGARGDPAIPFPPRRAGLRRRGPHSFLRIAATLRIAGRATRGMPRAPDPGAETNLRGVAAHAARWGGTGRAPSNPPALGLGGRRGQPRATSGTSRGSRRRGNSVH